MNKKTNKSIFRTKPLIKTRLVITHWNCLHLPSRVHLLDNFLAQKCPDIVLLNELKIDLSEANIYLDFQNYQFLTKPRNKYRGGVAILIKRRNRIYTRFFLRGIQFRTPLYKNELRKE